MIIVIESNLETSEGSHFYMLILFSWPAFLKMFFALVVIFQFSEMLNLGFSVVTNHSIQNKKLKEINI